MATLKDLKPLLAKGWPIGSPELHMIIQPTGYGDYCVFNPFVKMGHYGVDIDKAIRIASSTHSRDNHTSWEPCNQCFLIPRKEGL